jgi:hypothetical protein
MVILVALERRVQLDQVYRLLLDVAPQDVAVVDVVEEIVGHVFFRLYSWRPTAR